MPDASFPHPYLRLYDLAWSVFLPLLRRHQRFSDGLEQRVLRRSSLAPADIWIQAASAGESHLALLLAKRLARRGSVRIQLTATTRQGVDILRRGVAGSGVEGTAISTAFFPIDRPTTMIEAVERISPRLMVLVESEIWPGLLYVLKKNNCPVLVINGRLREKSLARYLLWPAFWRSLGPDRILAISPEDADRFKRLFPRARVDVMSNMKFDRIVPEGAHFGETEGLSTLLDPTQPFLVLGSVRKQEEPLIKKVIQEVMAKHKSAIVGVFPRHMHRIDHWKDWLKRSGISWVLRSRCNTPIAPNQAVLWDRFGELPMAYSAARAAFVGGSLVPLGGQNFLEPLMWGIRPVIGPWWENFQWVGGEIVKQGLVKVGRDWREVSDLLIQDLDDPPSREPIKKAILEYVKRRQGGTAYTSHVIETVLEGS